MKVGDRVIVNGEYDGLEFDHSVGIIIGKNERLSKEEDILFCVEFDEFIAGHGLCGGKSGHCWWVPEDMIKKEFFPEQSKWFSMMDYCKEKGLCPATPAHWRQAETAYYNTKNKTKGEPVKERIEELEKELAALKAQLKYEPKNGNWGICGNGDIIKTSGGEQEYLDKGRIFDTLEKAEKAKNIMVKHDIILKYVIDHAPDYEPNDEECASIYYHSDSNEWCSIIASTEECFGSILMPVWVADKLADDLNNNRIEGV